MLIHRKVHLEVFSRQSIYCHGRDVIHKAPPNGLTIPVWRKIGSTSGFTLIEIMIVVIIIGLLAGLVGPRLFGKLTQAKQKAAKAQIELFGTALDAFRLDVGRYPTSEEGLKILREKPSGVDTWKGPYLPKEIPVDPWGKAYIYKSPGEHGEYDLISYGLDGVEGGEGENQDVMSWKDTVK